MRKPVNVKNKGSKFLKKLLCCFGGWYDKIIWFYQLATVKSFRIAGFSCISAVRANDEGLSLETSALETLYSGHFTLLCPK